MQMGEQGHAPVDHRAGLRHNNGAAAARCHPVPLATVVALQSNTLILAHVMPSDRQDIVIDDVVIRAVEPRLPTFQTSEQPSKRFFITTAAFPIDQPILFPIVCFPDPDTVRLALHVMPHLVDFDDRYRLRFRLRAGMINIDANPVHHRLRTAPEQMTNSVE